MAMVALTKEHQRVQCWSKERVNHSSGTAHFVARKVRVLP